MGKTQNQILKEVTTNYLENISLDSPPSPSEIEEHLLNQFEYEFDIQHNSTTGKGNKWKPPHTLPPFVIGMCMLKLYHICQLDLSDDGSSKTNDIYMFQNEGEFEGLYVSTPVIIEKFINDLNESASIKEISEVMNYLKRHTPIRQRTRNEDLVAVNNGIFDYKRKELLPFSPDYVFTSKSHVDYNPTAANIIIHNDKDNTDWDVESWMSELSDDPEIVELLWQILGAIIRPNVRWDRAIFLYSDTGNNGKGTLCELMKQICGQGAYASIKLENFGKDFMLTSLTKVSAIITDENSTGAFSKNLGDFKAVVTGDDFQLNRKSKDPITVSFSGLVVQCINDLPRVSDKSDSFYRRQLFVPFAKCFTGHERKYIKNDYLHRKEVLQYVLYKVLNMDYYVLSEPEACKTLLNEYKTYNDPLRQFVDEFVSQCVWDFLPNGFLFEGYKAWFKLNIPSGTPLGRNTFSRDLKKLISDEWIYVESKPPKQMLDKPEPLIRDYDLKMWMNPFYTGKDLSRICTPALKSTYSGFIRIAALSDDDSEVKGCEATMPALDGTDDRDK